MYACINQTAVRWPYKPYGFFALGHNFRTARLTVQTVATDCKGRKNWPHLAVRTVSTASRYGFYGPMLRSLRSLRSSAPATPVSTISYYGLQKLIKASYRFQYSKDQWRQQRKKPEGPETGKGPPTDFRVTVRTNLTSLTVKTVGFLWYRLTM